MATDLLHSAFVPLSIYDELAAVHQPAAILALDGGLA